MSSSQRVAALLAPRSIAVVGASDDSTRLGGRPIANLRKFGFTGDITGVNPKYSAVQGERCVPAVAEVPVDTDLYIFASPASTIVPQFELACQRGMKGAVIFTSGFAELGREGEDAQARLRELSDRYGVATNGPNCLGYLSPANGVTATFATGLANLSELTPGHVAIVSQSGGFGMNVFTEATLAGATFSHVITTGNEAALGLSDYLEFLAEDPETSAIVGYVEGIRDGPSFVRQCRRLQEMGKPLVLLKSGTSEKGAQAAQTHTAASAGNEDAFDAVAARYGVARARSFDALVDWCRVLSLDVPQGALGVVTISGGAAVHISDGCADAGLPLADLAPATLTTLRALVPTFGIVGNPVDVTAQVITDPSKLGSVIDAVAADDATGVVMLFLGGSADQSERLISGIQGGASARAKPLIVAWNGVADSVRQRAIDCGLPTFSDALRPLAPLAHLLAMKRRRSEVEAPLMGADWSEDAIRPSLVSHEDFHVIEGPGAVLDDERGFGLVAAAGVPVPRRWSVATDVDLEKAADEAAFPCVLKVIEPPILHKSQCKAIVTNIRNEAALKDAVSELRARHGARRLLLLEQTEPGFELLVGVTADPTFGHRVVVGAGGVWANALQDHVTMIPPLEDQYVLNSLSQLRVWPVVLAELEASAATVQDLTAVVRGVWNAARAERDLVAELECNPVIINRSGLMAVDVLGIGHGQRPDGNPWSTKR